MLTHIHRIGYDALQVSEAVQKANRMQLCRPISIRDRALRHSVLAGLVALAGCAVWREHDPEEPSALPPVRLAADSVVLETVTFRLPWGEIDTEALWKQVDEQRIDPLVRKRLESNGFRIGAIGSEIPPMLAKHLEAEVGQQAGTVQQGDDFVTTPRTFKTRSGVPLEIASPETHEQLTYLRAGSQGELVCESLHQAQCMLITTPFPRGDSDLDLIVEPIVATGDPRQSVVPGDGEMFKIEVTPEKVRYPELRLSLRLAPGESLLMTCTDPARGLGEAFFTQETAGQTRQRLVLVRLAQTQQDDLFPLGSGPSTVTRP